MERSFNKAGRNMNYWHVWTPRGHDKARGEWVTPRLENKGSRERVQNINYAHIPFNNSYNAMKTIARVLGTRSTRTAGQWWGTTRTSEEAHLKEFLKNQLQTRKRRPQNFTVCDICLDCLHIHTPRVHAREVDTLSGEILRTPIACRQPIPSIWLVLCGLLTTGYTTGQRQSC